MAANGIATASEASTSAPTTLAVRLTTRRSQHAIPDSKYMVPADWRRYQLSELINKVLENCESLRMLPAQLKVIAPRPAKPVPFDFIVDGELLRTSIAAYIKAKGLSEVDLSRHSTSGTHHGTAGERS
jgi:ribosome biogenesis protein YTM1